MVMVLLLFLPNKLRFLKQQKLQALDDPEDDFAKKQNTVSSAFNLVKSRMLETLTYFGNGDTATLSIILLGVELPTHQSIRENNERY